MNFKVGDRVEHKQLLEVGIIEKIYRATGDANRTIRLNTGFYAPECQFQKLAEV